MSEKITCEEAIRLLAQYLDRELASAEEGRVREHLDTCRSCFSRAAFERQLKESLAELRDEPVQPGFEERIRKMIREFQSAR